MTRWNWKRWAFAIVTGTAMAGSFVSMAADDMPKAGETITLKFPGQPDRVVTVVKATRKPDGSLETEVKDGKTGDTFTLVDPAPENKVPTPVKPVAALPTPAIPPLPKPVANAVAAKPVAPISAPMPLPPIAASRPPVSVPVAKSPVASATPMPPMAEPRDKKLVGGGKLIPNTPAAAAASPAAPTEEAKKPGLIGRVFGKKPTPPVMVPAPAPVVATPAPQPAARTNAEPPRVLPVKPVAPPSQPGFVERVVPPTPVIPPISAPRAPDALPVPLPTKSVPPVIAPVAPPMVATPKPPVVVTPAPIPVPPPIAKPMLPPIAVPSLPAPIPVPTIPSVPLTPAVETKPIGIPEVVKPVSHVSIEALEVLLKDSPAPSGRLKAAKELATCDRADSTAVKVMLFKAAKTDPCAAVKADCIEYLAKLGYRDPAFVEFVKLACTDDSGEVRIAAKSAMVKLVK